MLAKGKPMHIDRANQIPMPGELASATRPLSAFGLVCMPTSRTLAACSSFRASEAHDVGRFGLVREIRSVFPVFPQGHTLIVVSPIVLVANTMRIAKKERAYLMVHTKVYHLAGGFVSQVTYATFCTTTLLVFGSLHLFPTTRRLLAPRLLFRHLAELFASQVFERTDTASGDDQSLTCVRSHGSQVDLAQIDGCLNGARSLLCLWNFHADMQLKAIVPNQTARPTVFGQFKGQDQGWASSAHRQNNAPVFFAHCLSRPLDRIKTFGSPGVLHLHLGMRLTELAGDINGGKEGGNDHLHRLALQGKTPFGGFLQLVSSWPGKMGETYSFMHLHTAIPYLCGFHLRSFEALEEGRR
ncbi:hypothetical protein KSC_057810 [Ktedonobacter sp. SOSP1-52]|nr:hypothetical protein KSC_057810 [Ktedonobacter sp. SOSP1-52]